MKIRQETVILFAKYN